MKNINIFCFGFGQVAKNFIDKLILENYNITLSSTTRNETKKKFLTELITKTFNLIVKNMIKIFYKTKRSRSYFSFYTTKKQEDLVIKIFQNL